MGRRRRWSKSQLLSFAFRTAKFLLKSQLFTLFFVLFLFGLWMGTRVRAHAGALPYEELFENLSVISYRESPSDSIPHFVAELSASGHVFRELDLDARRFADPIRGRDYRRAISGTHYPALAVRGHIARGFWLELPETSARALLPEQFQELYSSTLDYVKPVGVVTTVLGTLSGYSVGFRFATWSHSLANPAVQEHILEVPGIERRIAREAWRRVLIEPVVMGDESEAARFAAVHGTQRLYTNFFKLALHDSDRFIPRECARLDSTGHAGEAQIMRAFANAVRHAAADTSDLSSADFAAVENWASLLDRTGHWATGTIPRAGEERSRYLGTLAWYGIAPADNDERRIWVGPRLLVREGSTEGFVADDILRSPAARPTAWEEWLRPDTTGANTWNVQWMGTSREFAPAIQFVRGLAHRGLRR